MSKEETEDEHLEGELWIAALEGDIQEVTRLIQQGVDVNYKGYYRATLLHKAAEGGHVGDAELLLKAGARVDITDWDGKTPEDIAASEDVPDEGEKDRILEGRKRILELFGAVKMAGPYWRIVRKVGPEGGELQTASCTVTVPPGAVTMETEITCQVINPNDVTLPLKEEEMLLSDVIELGPHGTTFHQPVTVQMQYSSTSSGGDMEAVVWVTEDRLQWTELTTIEKSEDKLTVSVDHFSIFAVISQPKQDKFTVPTEECMLTSSTQPAVQVMFPKGSVNTDTQVILQVQDVPERAIKEIKAKDESFNGLLSTSPIVYVETVSESAVQFNKPVTVRVPHPQHYMDIQHEGSTKLKVMLCEEGTEDWVDVTDSTTITMVTEKYVEFEVSHFTSWIVVVIDDMYRGTEELGPIALHFCRWLQHRTVQFILLQKEDNRNQILIECKPAEDAEAEHAKLVQKGYTGPLPSDLVKVFEGQKVEIRLLGNVSLAPSCTQKHITFHSQRLNRLQMQVKGQEGSDGNGTAVFMALPRVKVQKERDGQAKIRNLRKKLEKLGRPSDPDVLQPKVLCELPISVLCETSKKTSEGAAGGATLKAVGKYFFFIKEEVSSDWMDLAFHLGLKGSDITNIAGRNPDDKSRCMDMLREWHKREGDAATTEVLIEALLKAGLKSVAVGLKSKHPQQIARYGQTAATRGEGNCPP